MSAQSVLFTLIQTGKLYEFIEIDFIDLFEKSAYGNIYIYNLVDLFSRCIYPYSTFDTNINNVIILFDYYLQANLKSYPVYIDAGLHFTNQKLWTYFQKKDITVVFVLLASYKSVGIIEKSNNIL